MPALSAVLITLNEESKLALALDSVAFCDEVVVVDAGSTDRTVALAQAQGARVVVNTPWPGFVAQRRLAVDAARHDWILAIDADERVSGELRAEIQALQTRGFSHAGYRVPRLATYLGREVRGTDWYPDPQLRLFDRRRADWDGGLVHESVRARGPVGRLRGDLLHQPYQDLRDHLRKLDRYTSLWAEQAQGEERRAGAAALLSATLWALIRNYVLRGGFRLGRAGLVISAINAYYTSAKLAKLAERTRQGYDTA